MKYVLYAAAFAVTLGLSAYLTTFLIVRGQPEVQVPQLTGQGAVTALKELSDLGLNLTVRAVDFSETVPKDHIISQDPPSGTRIKKGRDVRVVLSKGSDSVPLPDLRGLPLDQAATILSQSRLKTGDISATYSFGPENGRNRVLAQSPEPSVSVPVGAQVNLLLSLGPRPEYLTMPDLTGQPYTLALYSLERSDLVLGRLETEARPDWPVETVVLQEPGPGSRVAKGDLVRLTVNRAEGVELSEYRLELVDYRVPFGLLNREVRIRVAVGSFLVDIHDGWHPPGTRVRVLALVRGTLRAQAFEDGEESSLFSERSHVKGVLNDQNRTFDPFGRFRAPGG